MIVLHIAIQGDNEELAQAELARLCEHIRADSTATVYRAWTQRVSGGQGSINAVLDTDTPHEVKL